jgi:hypothetical protein
MLFKILNGIVMIAVVLLAMFIGGTIMAEEETPPPPIEMPQPDGPGCPFDPGSQIA